MVLTKKCKTNLKYSTNIRFYETELNNVKTEHYREWRNSFRTKIIVRIQNVNFILNATLSDIVFLFVLLCFPCLIYNVIIFKLQFCFKTGPIQ